MPDCVTVDPGKHSSAGVAMVASPPLKDVGQAQAPAAEHLPLIYTVHALAADPALESVILGDYADPAHHGDGERRLYQDGTVPRPR